MRNQTEDPAATELRVAALFNIQSTSRFDSWRNWFDWSASDKATDASQN